jgi:hypothetical protein
MSSPIWITPPGFLTTVTQSVSTSVSVSAVGTDVTYALISGSLPIGLQLNSQTGEISGTPSFAWSPVASTFVIRAQSDLLVADRTFTIDTNLTNSPSWDSNNLGYSNLDQSIIDGPILGFLNLAPAYANPNFEGVPIVVNRQYVDWQLVANATALLPGKKLFYFIPDNAGELPPGLILTDDGRLYGIVRDKTRIDYTFPKNARYDVGGYDITPYDYSSIAAPLGIKYFEKTYEFAVTATDGLSSATTIFKIHVKDPQFLSQDTIFTGYVQYPVPLQWIMNTDLGTIRSKSQNLFELRAYDPYPTFGSTNYSVIDMLPEYFSFNDKTQTLLISLPSIFEWNTNYTFTLQATKTNTVNNTSVSSTATFNISILGDGANYIKFASPSLLATMRPGELSTISIEVERTDGFDSTFELLDGQLPPGLSLAYDGSVVGKVLFSQSNLPSYTFIVRAQDSQRQVFIDGTFTINLDLSDSKIYTDIYLRPYLSEQLRSDYVDLVSTQKNIPLTSLYRPLDPNFGIQKELKLYLYYGIENVSLRYYVEAMQQAFYNKRLLFNGVKIAQAKHQNGLIIYEMVYIDLRDDFTNDQGQVISDQVIINDEIYYPNSISNMRSKLESILIDSKPIAKSEYYLPLYQKIIQQSPTNYLLAVPICYTKPGMAASIKKQLDNSGFDFKLIDFEFERIILEKSIETNTDQYLFFPNQTISK